VFELLIAVIITELEEVEDDDASLPDADVDAAAAAFCFE
jgi:hypothetical protein